MSVGTIGLDRLLPPLSLGMGLLAMGGGIYGLANPLTWSGEVFRVRHSLAIGDDSKKHASLAQLAAVRNVSSGLTILALLCTGHRQAVGICFLCGAVVALWDGWICTQQDDDQAFSKGLGHVVMGGVVSILGAGMLGIDNV